MPRVMARRGNGVPASPVRGVARHGFFGEIDGSRRRIEGRAGFIESEMPIEAEAQNRDVETAAGRDHALNARGVVLGVRGQRLEANEAIHPDLVRIEKNALQPGREQSMVGLGEAQVLVELCHLETGERGAMAVREFSKHAFGCGAYRKCGKRCRSGRCADVTNGDGSPAAEIRVIVRNDQIHRRSPAPPGASRTRHAAPAAPDHSPKVARTMSRLW